METIAKSGARARAVPHARARSRRPVLPRWCHWLFAPLAAAVITLCAAWIQLEGQIFTYQFSGWRAYGGTVRPGLRAGSF